MNRCLQKCWRRSRHFSRKKAARTPAERKIESRLLYAIKQQRGEPLPAGISLRLPSLAPDARGRIEVDIASRAGTDLRAMLTSSNAVVMNVTAESRGGGVYARARIDANGIMALAARADVTDVRLPPDVEVAHVARGGASLQSIGGQGTFVTEGLLTHQFNIARTAFGFDGTGVKIGVLADGVAHLADSQPGRGLR
jgi:hypothetical protein